MLSRVKPSNRVRTFHKEHCIHDAYFFERFGELNRMQDSLENCLPHSIVDCARRELIILRITEIKRDVVGFTSRILLSVGLLYCFF